MSEWRETKLLEITEPVKKLICQVIQKNLIMLDLNILNNKV